MSRAKVKQHRNGTQRAEDAADAQGIGNGLLQAVLSGDGEIGDGAGIVAADLNGIYHVISVFQCRPAVFYPDDKG